MFAMNIHVQRFVWAYIFHFGEHMPRREIAEIVDNSMFNFLRILFSLFI